MFIKKHSKKLMMLAATGIVAFPLAVNAASTTIDARARFLQTITLSGETQMNFGTIEYSGTPGAADTVTMTGNGTLTAAGVFTAPATGTPGSVDVATGTAGETVEVYCSTSATLAEPGGATIDVTGVTVAAFDDAGTTDTACAGPATIAITYVLGSGTQDTFRFGGVLDGGVRSGTWTDGTYLASTGGTPISVDVIYP